MAACEKSQARVLTHAHRHTPRASVLEEQSVDRGLGTDCDEASDSRFQWTLQRAAGESERGSAGQWQGPGVQGSSATNKPALVGSGRYRYNVLAI